jgi:hypothetical protein
MVDRLLSCRNNAAFEAEAVTRNLAIFLRFFRLLQVFNIPAFKRHLSSFDS